MTLHFNTSVLVDRPAEEVWAYLSDETHDPIWRRPYCKQVHHTGPIGLGTRYEGVDNMGPYVMVLTRHEPPFRMSWREETPRSLQQREGNYILTREGDSTRMTLDVTYDSNGLKGKVMEPVLSLMAPGLGRKLMSQLKTAVEGKPAP